MQFDQFPVNVFDFVLAAVLGVGLLRGRKHGMSEELLGLLKWLAVIVVCGCLYEPVGKWLAQESPFSLLSSYLIVYVTTALLVLGAFALVKHSLGGKLIGSDIFGQGEYYLGMGSGLIRYGCILVTLLAVLNARYFTPAEVNAMASFQKDVYGSEFFPTLHSAQATVFEKSLSGPLIRQYLSFLLITPTKPEAKDFHQREAALPY
jgi:uncharacterized membrane protein required for colicin V production